MAGTALGENIPRTFAKTDMTFTLLRHLPGWGAGLQTTQLGGEGFWMVKGTQSHTDNCRFYCDRRNLSEAPVGEPAPAVKGRGHG